MAMMVLDQNRPASRRRALLWCTLIAGLGAAVPLEAIARPPPDPPKPTRKQLVDRYTFHVPMKVFQRARRHEVRDDLLIWKSDGCSFMNTDKPFYVANFLPACQRHDFGYRNYKEMGRFTEKVRHRIDNNFRKDLHKTCSRLSRLVPLRVAACLHAADSYYGGVRACGGKRRPAACPDA
jgi:hypothetical protein